MNTIEVTAEEWVNHVTQYDGLVHRERDNANMLVTLCDDREIAYIIYKPKKKYFIIK